MVFFFLTTARITANSITAVITAPVIIRYTVAASVAPDALSSPEEIIMSVAVFKPERRIAVLYRDILIKQRERPRLLIVGVDAELSVSAK